MVFVNDNMKLKYEKLQSHAEEIDWIDDTTLKILFTGKDLVEYLTDPFK